MSDDAIPPDYDLEKVRQVRQHHEPYESDPEFSPSISHSSANIPSSYHASQQSLPQIEKTQSRLSHIGSAGLERANSTLSTIRSRRPIPPFSHPLTHEKTKPDVIVGFDGEDDPYRPLNWPFKKKVWTTVSTTTVIMSLRAMLMNQALYGFTTMGATFASSVYSPALAQVSAEYKVGTEVSTLGVSLLLFGFGLGPIIFAPLSEVYGRKKAVLIPYFLAAIFSFATGASKDIAAICVTR